MSWVRQHGGILPRINDGLRQLNTALDNLENHQDVDGFALAARRFAGVLDEALALPPIPGQPEGRLYGDALRSWHDATGCWSTAERVSDPTHFRAGMDHHRAATRSYGQLGAALNGGRARPLRALHALWSTPREAARVTAEERRTGTVPKLPEGGVQVDINRAALSLRGGPTAMRGFWFALVFGLAAWGSVIASLAIGEQAPVVGLVVIAVLGTAFLLPVAGALRGGFLMRRTVDAVRVDATGIIRVGHFVAFEVAWSEVSGVRVLFADAFPGESAWAPFKRRPKRGSRMGVEFVPVNADRFARAHGVLANGPAHQRFRAMGGSATGGRYGCELGVLGRRKADRLSTALQRAAPALWLGEHVSGQGR